MFDHLFKPISVNGMILKNRIIATPTGDDFEEKAMGGAALVIAGHAIVEPGRSSFASPEEPYPFAKYEREEVGQRPPLKYFMQVRMPELWIMQRDHLH